MRIGNVTQRIASRLWANLEPSMERLGWLEQAAQRLARAFHMRFSESIVLARVFMTVPFGGLPSENRQYVRNLAESAGAAGDLEPGTPVLSLIGTYGDEDDWRDRRKSKGHVGIPLISTAFVEAIPMISRLLKELGVPLEWVARHDSEIVRAMGLSAGLFFVDDATSAIDHEGRKIIPAQDFVSKYGVKTVFGTGGAYMNGQILVLVVFCRDLFSRAIAEHFTSVTDQFMFQTARLADPAKVFANA